MIKLIVRSH